MNRTDRIYKTLLRDALTILPPAALFAVLLADVYERWAPYWFAAAALVLLCHAVLAITKKDLRSKRYSLFMAGLMIAGVTGLPGQGWAHMAYIPYVLATAIFFDTATLAFIAVSAVLLDSGHLLAGNDIHVEIFLFSVVFLSALLGLLARSWKLKHDAFLKTRYDTFNFNWLTTGKGFDHEQDAELRYILKTVMFTIMPGSVSLFLVTEGELAVRCSTEDDIRILPEGLIHEAFAGRTTMVSNTLSKRGHNPGYGREGKILSLIAAAVMDDTIPLGILAVDSRRVGAFSDADVKALELFANQIAGMLSRQRILSEIKRSHRELRILQEESSRLMSTMDLGAIYDIAVSGAYNISSMGTALFQKNKRSFELVSIKGIDEPARTKFTLKNTLAEMAIKNSEPMYIPNTKGYNLPVLPFAEEGVSSALILPIIYNEEVLGVMTSLSAETDPLSPRDMELLSVLVNQSAISIKNAMLHEEIKRRSITDGLTGLFNHKHFQERFAHELRRHLRSQQPLSLLLLDIDFFKKVNDTYGHPAGDKVLMHVAAVLRGTLRDIDIPARYGGEEFAAVLVETDTRMAAMTAERLRRELSDSVIRVDGHEIRITASVGVASYPSDAATKDEIISRSDKALYHAKENGRNMVVTWDSIR